MSGSELKKSSGDNKAGRLPYLGPRGLSQFELQAFFSFSAVEHELISRRRGDSLKLDWRCTSAS